VYDGMMRYAPQMSVTRSQVSYSSSRPFRRYPIVLRPPCHCGRCSSPRSPRPAVVQRKHDAQTGRKGREEEVNAKYFILIPTLEMI
jgi:hypothetical protein